MEINHNMTSWKTTYVLENPSHVFSEDITKEIIKFFELDKNEEQNQKIFKGKHGIIFFWFLKNKVLECRAITMIEKIDKFDLSELKAT